MMIQVVVVVVVIVVVVAAGASTALSPMCDDDMTEQKLEFMCVIRVRIAQRHATFFFFFLLFFSSSTVRTRIPRGEAAARRYYQYGTAPAYR